MKQAWGVASNLATTITMLIVAGLITYVNWPESPWMQPAVEVKIVNGQPRLSFVGEVVRPAPQATYGVDIKAIIGGIEETVCVGGYDPARRPNYAPDEGRPKNKPLSWWIEKVDRSKYPNGCEAELRPGYEHAIYTSWCNAAGECVSASARWVQP